MMTDLKEPHSTGISISNKNCNIRSENVTGVELVEKILNQISLHQSTTLSLSTVASACTPKLKNSVVTTISNCPSQTTISCGQTSYAKKFSSNVINSSRLVGEFENYGCNECSFPTGDCFKYKNSKYVQQNSQMNNNVFQKNQNFPKTRYQNHYQNQNPHYHRGGVHYINTVANVFNGRSDSNSSLSRSLSIKPSPTTSLDQNKQLDDSGPCSQCEYYFIDGQIIRKTKCIHRSLSSLSEPIILNKQPETTICENSHSQKPHDFISETNWMKSIDEIKRENNENCRGSSQITQLPPKQVSLSVQNSRPCIIQPHCPNIQQFVEAQIVFDKNMIGVVPIQDQNFTKNENDLNKKENNENNEINNQDSLVVVDEEEDVDSETIFNTYDDDIENESIDSLKKMSKEWLNYQKKIDINPIEQSKSITKRDLTAFEKRISVSGVEDREESPNATSAQVVKRAKCLIANFITIHFEEEKEMNGSNLSPQCENIGQVFLAEDFFGFIDFERLGFQNFDGNNIGLYKNIGYINRNKCKFIQPTNDLLKLLLQTTNTEKNDVSKKIDSLEFIKNDATDSAKSKENLSFLMDCYDTENIDISDKQCYSKSFIYSILDVLVQNEENFKYQVKGQSFRYPDCECSSDCEEYFNISNVSELRLSQQQSQSIQQYVGDNNKHNERSSPVFPTDNISNSQQKLNNEKTLDGSVKIRITTCNSNDVLNEKLFDVLMRSFRRSRSTTTSKVSANVKTLVSPSTSIDSTVVSANEKTESLKQLLNLESYYVTEVSLNGSF